MRHSKTLQPFVQMISIFIALDDFNENDCLQVRSFDFEKLPGATLTRNSLQPSPFNLMIPPPLVSSWKARTCGRSIRPHCRTRHMRKWPRAESSRGRSKQGTASDSRAKRCMAARAAGAVPSRFDSPGTTWLGASGRPCFRR